LQGASGIMLYMQVSIFGCDVVDDSGEGKGARERTSASVCRQRTSVTRDADDSCEEAWRSGAQSLNTTQRSVVTYLSHSDHSSVTWWSVTVCFSLDTVTEFCCEFCTCYLMVILTLFFSSCLLAMLCCVQKTCENIICVYCIILFCFHSTTSSIAVSAFCPFLPCDAAMLAQLWES